MPFAQSFSALQRAENFSTIFDRFQSATPTLFQCSSASRKFLNSQSSSVICTVICVSVLFSEPKISQSASDGPGDAGAGGFSALQRAENFSTVKPQNRGKISKSFSALQRAENFSIMPGVTRIPTPRMFQCSSASRKFLNPTLAPASIHIPDRDDHASSFLSLPGVSL